jgi:hypothetical protein
VAWYHEEIARLREPTGPGAAATPLDDWAAFERAFLQASGSSLRVGR